MKCLSIVRTLLWSVLAWQLDPATVHAYCRATTLETAALCPSSCGQSGVPLYWGEREQGYSFHFSGFPALDDGAMRAAFVRAFDQWSSIQCDGTPSGFVFDADPGATALTSGPLELVPDKNVIVHYSAREWADRKLPPRAYALTALWFDKDTGEIVDADIQFNGNMGQFAVCPDTGCATGQIDLVNVATHEVGHFIGLGHSEVAESAMWCSAPPTDLSKRVLSEDDKRGFCAIYPRGERPVNGSTVDEGYDVDGGGGCATATYSPRGDRGYAIWLFSLLLVARRRRRCT